MSSTTDNIEDFRGSVSPDARAVKGAMRLMAVRLTNDANAWQCRGHLMLDNLPEIRQAPPFSGIGFYGRPASGHRAEAVVAFVGGAANPVIIASRDEDARRAIAELDPDQTAMFNSTTIVLIKGSTVEIRTAAGTALALPTLADYEALRTFVNAQFTGPGHTHGVSGAATNSTVPVGATPGSPAGTVVLKAQ